MGNIAEAAGARIRQARLAAGLTREQLAVHAGIASRTVTRVENGEDATMGTIIALADVLGLTITLTDDAVA
jgi:transcriptional regulator with XRE-family HTH domain